MSRFVFIIILNLFSLYNLAFSEVIKKVEVIGNQRISNETIKIFAAIPDDDVDTFEINRILKNLYSSNFFEEVNVKLKNEILVITVKEFPLIENFKINGVKSKTLLAQLSENLNSKSRTSYNEIFVKKDIENLRNILKNLGYYFSEIDVETKNLDDNKVDLNITIDLGNKAKIKKIRFIGNKIFKDSKLKSAIISEEYKFWKIISGKKYLNENVIKVDNRLLKNFYLNKGYYNVKINSSFAKLINDDAFELIFNIDPNDKIFFNELDLNLPEDYNIENFKDLTKLFEKIKGEPYSLYEIEKIIDKIELLALTEQFESIDVNISENFYEDKLNLTFNIIETEKFYVNRINIFGNDVTNENVIRNQFILDEGDPFNKILLSKSINNIKKLNFFKDVNFEVLDNEDSSKTINITLEEKPTGEISAGAGFGTSGSTLMFSVKENNFLGNGIALNSSITLSEEAFKGQINVVNPNFRNTDKSIYYNIQALELDRLSDFGYKSNKVGFSLGTNFEYLEDLNLGLGFDNYVEKIETDSTASLRQRSQSGNYWDSFLNLDFFYDKRNQKYQPSSGFISDYSIKIPTISKSATLTNSYDYKFYKELFENNVTSFAFSISTSNSLNNKDIKLSERIYLPSRKLRGFESGKVGPKDGNDFIGGNYSTTLNFASTLPQILENNQNLDILLFFDAANLWGIDYDSSIDDGNGLRSSVGIGIDWLTPIGPLSFSLAQPISKVSTDVTESFRFNLGTSF